MKNDELQKHTLNLYAGDFDRLGELFPDFGASTVIRSVVRKFLEQCESVGSSNVQPPEMFL